MARIVYTVTLDGDKYPVQWLDHYGREHYEILLIEPDGIHSRIDLVHREFRFQHRGAVYLPKGEYDKHMTKLEADKAKLAAWKEWAV